MHIAVFSKTNGMQTTASIIIVSSDHHIYLVVEENDYFSYYFQLGIVVLPILECKLKQHAKKHDKMNFEQLTVQVGKLLSTTGTK
jgi:hypothetical protein